MRVINATILYLLFFVESGLCQSCKTYGEACADTYQCCGGCCIKNICIDTYEDCHNLSGNPWSRCSDYYCPAGSECRLYKPHCKGCDIQIECLFVDTQSTQPRNDDLEISMIPVYASAPNPVCSLRFMHYLLFYFLKFILN